MLEADQTDPFNYPFPSRKDLMSLQTISDFYIFFYIKIIFGEQIIRTQDLIK